MSSPQLVAAATSTRTSAEARVARIFRQTQRCRAQGIPTIEVKVADLEALVITAAVRQAVNS